MSGASKPIGRDPIVTNDEAVVWIVFQETATDHYVVDVCFDIDPNAPDEAPLTRFDPRRACVRSRVDLDLNGDHALIHDHFSRTYRDLKFASLCQAPQPGVVAQALAREALFDIARSGQSVFNRLFLHQHYEEPVRGPNPEVERAVRSALRRADAVHVDCTGGGPIYPWAFLHDDDALDEIAGAKFLDLTRFWGLSRVLQVEHADTARTFLLAAPLMVGSALCPTVLSTPTPLQGADPFAILPAGRAERRALADVSDLRDALADMRDGALYALVHARHELAAAPATSRVIFDNNPISVQALLGRSVALGTNEPVLVFLNACETSVLRRWDHNTIPGHLIKRHARRLCYLGTSAEVPRPLAVEFARGFWERLLRGESAGRAVLDTRRALFERSGNPLGLLYSLHGKARTHMPPAAGTIDAP